MSSYPGARELLGAMAADGVGPAKALQLARLGDIDPSSEDLARADEILGRTKQIGAAAYAYFDKEFPEVLRGIPSPPAVIFTKGSFNFADILSLAVVGSREPSERALQLTYDYVANLGKGKTCVVSGLAFGVDRTAHAAAIEQELPTIAVVGSGLDVLSPREHHGLAEEILQSGGGLLSEQFPGVLASGPSLVARNRLQTGLSDAVLVVASEVAGGSMYTARFAVEQGRKLLVPAGAQGATVGAGVALLRSAKARDLPISAKAWQGSSSFHRSLGSEPAAEAVRPAGITQALMAANARRRDVSTREKEVQLRLGD
jgi:DNA protecting protein DprA